jgi:integrase/ribosomal protein L37AE/L43A
MARAEVQGKALESASSGMLGGSSVDVGSTVLLRSSQLPAGVDDGTLPNEPQSDVTTTNSTASLDITSSQSLLCPKCGRKVVRAGQRKIYSETIQRWLCYHCDFRFSDPAQLAAFRKMKAKLQPKNDESKVIKSQSDRLFTCQIRVQETKNLGPEQLLQQTPERRIDIAGKLVEYAWKMQKEGYDKETIRGNCGCLRALALRGADLAEPESVKEVLSKEQKWSQNRRRNVINAYTLLLKFDGKSWIKPKCLVTVKFPFIPSEKEIDDLIAASSKKQAAFLQTLKETAMRSGEAKRLKWLDVDCERCIITLNEPEKHSNPRMLKVSSTLIEMLNALPKKSEYIFTGSLKSMKTTFQKTRQRLAETLANPRLIKIHYHTLRHWKATMTYHQCKDPYYVQHLLGHKSLKSTEIYINIEHSLFEAGANDQFTVRIVEKPEEIKELLEAGFEYVCQKDTLIFLRKRK